MDAIGLSALQALNVLQILAFLEENGKAVLHHCLIVLTVLFRLPGIHQVALLLDQGRVEDMGDEENFGSSLLHTSTSKRSSLWWMNFFGCSGARTSGYRREIPWVSQPALMNS